MSFDAPLLRPSRLPLALALAIALGALYGFRHLPLPESPLGRGTVLLQDVSVFDPKPAPGLMLLHQDLLWVDGRVRALRPTGKAVPDGATVIAGKGQTALPGLCDAAVFLSLEGRFALDAVPADPALSLKRELASGVTCLLDLNAHRTFMQRAREVLAGTSQAWPRVRFAGALFTAPGGWRLSGQSPWDSHVAELQEIEDLEASWPLHLRFRDEAVFASVEHDGRDDLAIPLPVLQRLGELAHAQGTPFIVHAQHAGKALQALEARPDAILGPLLDDAGAAELAVAMKRAGCAYLPALGTVLNGWPQHDMGPEWERQGTVALQGVSLLARASDPALTATWLRRMNRQELQRPALLRALLTIYLAKVPLCLGTGSGLPLVFHGSGHVAEMELWREAGVPAAAGLRAATLNSHRLLRLEGGRLAPGERADLLLVAGDPLSDPATLARPLAVYVGGQTVPPLQAP